MPGEWDDEERTLRERATSMRTALGLDEELARLGIATLTGSAALRTMVARDIDITVAVPALDAALMREVASLAWRLLARPEVREALIRDDRGSWNVDPDYPDGVYLHLVARDAAGDAWTFDIWFVDEPERQPDLDHVRTLGPRVTPEAQRRILALKRADGERPGGDRIPGIEIYRAVLDHDARTLDDVRRFR